ncbi:MAG: 50S ribosomal protein L31 [Candidatus Sumerlaeota bacterium]|nr:50S ribosomal protein L31 [Candidatus Sumerlaeota bacterium]
MRKDIHPKYTLTTIACVCGNKFQTRSTKPNQRLDICSKCHPFFTGQQKYVDTAGRVEKFFARYGEQS